MTAWLAVPSCVTFSFVELPLLELTASLLPLPARPRFGADTSGFRSGFFFTTLCDFLCSFFSSTALHSASLGDLFLRCFVVVGWSSLSSSSSSAIRASSATAFGRFRWVFFSSPPTYSTPNIAFLFHQTTSCDFLYSRVPKAASLAHVSFRLGEHPRSRRPPSLLANTRKTYCHEPQ